MKKILFLMSCVLIQGSLLFAASNSKDHGKNSKSKVEAAAAPASAAAAASAQSKTRFANTATSDIPKSTILSAEEAQTLGLDVPIAVETPFPLDVSVPKGYRGFGCTETSFHQHFCKENAAKQAHEHPILFIQLLEVIAQNQCAKPLWARITSSLKNNQNIPQLITVIPHDPCLYAKGPNLQDKFAIDLDLPDEVLPHRIESPTPDGYESDDSVDSMESCENCPVKGASHRHFKKIKPLILTPV